MSRLPHFSLLAFPSPTGKTIDLWGATPTPRLVTGQWSLGTGGWGRGFPLHRSGHKDLPTILKQFNQQVDAVDWNLAVAVHMQLLAGMCESWMLAVDQFRKILVIPLSTPVIKEDVR